MENQPAAKKSKMLKTEDDASSSVKRGGVSGDVGEMEIVQDQDYFTPALMDVWPKILDYVTDSKDVLSAMNASTVFYSLLEKRKASALLPLVLPILMSHNEDGFVPREVFNCRLVSKRMRTSVDNFLINYKHRDVFLRDGSYALDDYGVSRTILKVTPGINWNPFVARYCDLVLDQTNDLEVLKRHGHELYKVDVVLWPYSTTKNEMNILERALRFLPNLQSLKLEFPCRDVEERKNFRTPAHSLPALNSFTKLKLTLCYIYCDDEDYSPPSYVRSMLLTYRNQLTSLYCEWFVFSDSSWTSITFPHLLHLEVVFPCSESFKWIKHLEKFHCPQLRSLTCFVDDLGTELFLALNNFRGSLQKLRFKSSFGAALPLFQMDPFDVREFPQLTCLILSPDDAETPACHLFRILFPKLKELKFQYARNGQRVPDESIRRGYFAMFPYLKRITWTLREYRTRARPPLYTETVFTRQN